MSHDVNPPSSDELIVRHAFYSKVSAEINSNLKDIDNIANNLREFVSDFEVIKDEVRATETRNKTIVTVAAIIWTVVGGSIGFYIQNGLSGFEKQTERLSNVEIRIDKNSADLEYYKNNIKRDLDDIRLSIKK